MLPSEVLLPAVSAPIAHWNDPPVPAGVLFVMAQPGADVTAPLSTDPNVVIELIV